ncbi:threonine aldolase family protein [Anaeromicrobium sediminis]|uniref:Threonine aldolase n=1 Tax=Anaeromicrobium sediminis TaxID=1478221 RepID=A0A267MCT6_9FIRM|nr:low specificity L-threonine aldolase [Anaeromicrobium sediminis]PAB57404.1 threonine aldolase [Anaeromicrobium sediminis]
MKMFLSDNNSGVHENILKKIVEANVGHALPYGNCDYTKEAMDKFKKIFEKEVDVYFVATGTAANVVGLSGLLRPFEAVVCADTAHINVDECGSLERFSGCKILYGANENGKLTLEKIKELITCRGDEHQVHPKAISISQPTEKGTLYSIEEIKELADFAHERHMLLHIDGARISNAVVALNTNLKEMICDTGVDLLSFGGTKNGMMIGEAIVCLNPDLSKYFKYIRKQGMQLISKMRFVSAQFIGYLEDDLWIKNAQNSNSMAKLLERELMDIHGITMAEELETNMIFVHLPKHIIEPLKEEYPFYVLDEESSLVRLVTSFDTNRHDVESFIKRIKELI